MRRLGPLPICSSIVLGAVVALAACSGGSDGISVSVDKDHFCSEIAKVMCENVFRCCTGDQIEESLGITQTTSESQCRKDMELKCEEANAELLFALEKGTVVVEDETGATTCLESFIVEDSCFLFAPEFPAAAECEQPMLKGTQGVGKDCVDTIECVEDAYCGPDRKCRALPRQDQQCDNAGPKPCAAGLYCDEEYVCQSLRKGGEDCDTINVCDKDLFCDTKDPEQDPTCKDKKAVGASCKGDKECDSDLCIPGLCANGDKCYSDDDCDGTCEDSGEECSSDDDCPGTCDTSGKPCQVDWDCPDVEDVCTHPICESSCRGKPVCGEHYDVFDYCDISMQLFKGI